MEITRIRHFCAVVEAGSLRRAAEVLRMSPGALSKSLSVFQAELNGQVFLNSNQRLILTDAGKTTYNLCVKLLQDLERMREQARGSQESSTLKIATFEVFSSYVLADIITREPYTLSLKCLEAVPGVIEETLLNHSADIGITYVPIQNSHLEHLPICRFSFGLFGRHDKFGKTFTSEIPFSIPTTSIPMLVEKIRTLDNWPESKFPRNVKHEFELLQTGLVTASRGQAVLFCPNFVAHLYNGLVNETSKLQSLQLPRGFVNIPQTVYIVKRRSEAESPFIKKLSSSLRSICKDKTS